MINETTINNFNEKYADKGGVTKLMDLYKQGLSSPAIGKHFNLEGKQIDYYLKRLIGKDYLAWPWRKAMSDLGVGPRIESN